VADNEEKRQVAEAAGLSGDERPLMATERKFLALWAALGDHEGTVEPLAEL